MEKYQNKQEYETIRLMMEIKSDSYRDELFHAVMAKNSVAVEYMLNKMGMDEICSVLSDLLIIANDVLVVEVLLKSINYRVYRRLNACLSKIKSLEILNYIINHDYAHFNIGYKKSECVRYAVLNDDIERVKCFLMKKGFRNIDLTIQGLDTKNKCCVELAFDNGNDDMLELFINSGLEFYSDTFSEPLKERLRYIKGRICKNKFRGKLKIIDLYSNSSMSINDLPEEICYKAFPECMYDVAMTRLKAKRLIKSIHHSTTV